MIDEYLEEKIDRICEAAPRYFGPRLVRFCSNPFGWRMLLYASAVRRTAASTLLGIRQMNEQVRKEDLEQIEREINPKYANLDPENARRLMEWDAEQEAWKKEQEKKNRKLKTPASRLKAWWAGRHERGAARDQRWAQRDAQAQRRAQLRMQKAAPLMEMLQRSQFPYMLLITVLSLLGVCASGGGDMGYVAASCCLMWLAAAFETQYVPVCGGVRQRYLAVLLLRAAASLALLPMYFFRYLDQGVRVNLLLQSTMLILLFAHAVFYLALVAFNRRQPPLLRTMAGLLGVIPALMAAAAIAFAATQIARPMPLPVVGVIGAVGALLAFAADRLVIITELGGIRLRYTPIWVTSFMEIGYLLILIGAWMAA